MRHSSYDFLYFIPTSYVYENLLCIDRIYSKYICRIHLGVKGYLDRQYSINNNQ